MYLKAGSKKISGLLHTFQNMCKSLVIKGHVDYTIFSQLVLELSYEISPLRVTTHPVLTLLRF